MKVLQVNCVYKKGSTGKITNDIHTELINKGIESVVCYGRGEIIKEPHVYKTCGEFYSHVNHFFSYLTGIVYGGCFFSTNKLIRIIKREKPDVVHLQCINGYFVNIYRLLNWLKANHIRVVLTLHAEFMYTGGCSHSIDCNQWSTNEGCGHSRHCPRWHDETHSYFFDRTGTMWKRMKKSFEGFEHLIVCPVTDWLSARALKSPILGFYPIKTVLNGIDTSVFHYDKITADDLRSRLGIGDRKMILHVTASYTNPIKGGKFITELSNKLDSNKYVVVVVDGANDAPPADFDGIYYGRANTQNELAAFYSAADVMVLTSYRECLPTTCVESLCCGTEIVSFYFHGNEGENSFPEKYVHFIPHGDMTQLVEKVKTISERHCYKNVCEEECSKLFSKDVMANHYLQIYSDICSQVKK